MPKFSIIIPVYNVAPYLRKCLDSVLAQTFTDWEAICVDDGSTDGSGAILDEYAARDSRFRVFHKENGGVSSARNYALDNVKGEYVGFIDGDDWILPDWFKTFNSIIHESPGIDWVRMENRDFINNGYRIKNFTVLKEKIEQTEILQFGWEQISKNGVMVINLYRKELLKNSRFDIAVKIREDALFSLELLPTIKSCVSYKYDGYVYRILESSATRKKKPVDVSVSFQKALLSVWEKQKRLFPKTIKRKISKAYAFLIYKDINQWYSVRDRDSREDRDRLKKICRSAWRSGAISFAIRDWRKSLRVYCFMITGSFKAFTISFRR